MMRIGIVASKQTSEEETGGENTETWHKVNHFLDFSVSLMGVMAWMLVLFGESPYCINRSMSSSIQRSCISSSEKQRFIW